MEERFINHQLTAKSTFASQSDVTVRGGDEAKLANNLHMRLFCQRTNSMKIVACRDHRVIKATYMKMGDQARRMADRRRLTPLSQQPTSPMTHYLGDLKC